MKQILPLLTTVLLVYVAPALAGVSVVELTAADGTVTYDMLDASALKELQKAIADETRLFPKALIEAEKEWKANPANKTAFPKSAVAPRKFRMVQAYPDAAQASAKMTELTDSVRERELKKKERADAKAKAQKKDKDAAAREKQKEAAKAALEKAAVDLVQAKLDVLRGGAPAAATPAAADAKAKPEEKKDGGH